MTVRRHELTDAEWERLAPLLPPEKPTTGKPNKAHRPMVNAILWKLGTGAPWRDLPERYGPWESVYTRFRRWRLAGVWDQVLATVQTQGDAEGKLDWSVQFLDGTVIRAHQHAAGAKGGTRKRKPWGGARAGSARKSISARKAGASR
jgi:transposase